MSARIGVGDRVWIDPAYGHELTAPVTVVQIEAGAALLPGFGWFDLDDLTPEHEGDPQP